MAFPRARPLNTSLARLVRILSRRKGAKGGQNHREEIMMSFETQDVERKGVVAFERNPRNRGVSGVDALRGCRCGMVKDQKE